MSRAYIITNPMIAANKSIEVTLSKFIRVIRPFYKKIWVIGGNLSVESDLDDVELISFNIMRVGNKIKRALDILGVQLKMYYAVLKMIQKNDQVFFWIGDKMILPYIGAKHKKAEINYFIMGNVAKEGVTSFFTRASAKMIRYMAEHANYTCMESRSVIDEWPGLSVKNTRVIHLYTTDISMNPITEREKIIGMVCRLTSGKHVLESMEAIASIHSLHPEWRLEIVGSGRQQEECEKMITNLHAEEYIKLFGWIEHDKVIDLSKHWKFFLFPTDTEGMPNGLIEMMGKGIPSLTTSVGGIKDIVIDNLNGFFVADNSQNSIMEGILKLIDIDENTYFEYANRSYETIKKEFSLDGAIRNAKDALGF